MMLSIRTIRESLREHQHSLPIPVTTLYTISTTETSPQILPPNQRPVYPILQTGDQEIKPSTKGFPTRGQGGHP